MEPQPIEKYFISPQELLLDSFRLAKQIYNSEYRPTFLLALWRGGTPTGIAVQEFLSYKGVKTDHIPPRTSLYRGINEANQEVRVHGIDYVVNNANYDDSLLIIDDVFETGKSIQAVVERLQSKMRKNLPREIKVGTVYYKPERNQTPIIPDFYIHQTDRWLVFPHELEGLSLEEICEGKGIEIAELAT